VEPKLGPLGTSAIYWPIVPDPGDCEDGEFGGMNGRETEVLGENLPRRHLSTTNPTWPDPGLNPGRRGGKPATNRFSYGAAKSQTSRLARRFQILVYHKFFLKLQFLLCSYISLKLLNDFIHNLGRVFKLPTYIALFLRQNYDNILKSSSFRCGKMNEGLLSALFAVYFAFTKYSKTWL
jgi:hypothetical protein